MKSKIAYILCCLTILISLSGCQLAQNTINDDKLIGLLVTHDHLSSINLPNKKEGKIFATIKDETSDYIFEGFNYASVFLVHDFSSDISSTYFYHSNVLDSISSTNVNPENSDIDLIVSGVAIVSNKSGSAPLFFHEIYLNEIGEIYIITSTSHGLGFEMDYYQNGSNLGSSSTKYTSTFTYNGITSTETMKATIFIKSIFTPTEINILHMDINNTLLSENKYKIEELPDSIETSFETQYLIVEEYFLDKDNNEQINRTIYNKSNSDYEGIINSYICEENKICEIVPISIIWK